MFWAVCLARMVLGLPFLLLGLNHFFAVVPIPAPALPDNAAKFSAALADSGYLSFVKLLEITGGLLVLSGRFVPLGVTILAPIAVNILLFEIYMVGTGGPGVALTVLCGVLIWAYRSSFASLFAAHPKIG